MNPQIADDQELLLRRWLHLIASLILVLVIFGTTSRLDHSGPLIGTYGPISSFLPPVSAHDWQMLFDRFRQIPGFSVDEDASMNLLQFEHAYLLEWAHLLTEHLIDGVLLIGFIVLFTRSHCPRRIVRRFRVLILLGTCHALLGWWFGVSGLNHHKDLVQFAVAARLTSACLLFAWSIWLARRLKPTNRQPVAPNYWFWAVAGLGTLIVVQMICGAFVVGLRSSTVFDTWPLIDGSLVPKDLWFFSPWWKNLVENALSVQFMHRLLGYVVLLFAATLVIISHLPSVAQPGIRRTMAWVALLVFAQVCLGVAAVLSVGSLPFAIGHLVTAFAIVGLLAIHLADLSAVRSHADVVGLEFGATG